MCQAIVRMEKSDTLQEWLDIPIFVLVLSGRSKRNRAHEVKGKQGVAKPFERQGWIWGVA